MYFYAGDRTEERLVAAKAAADRALALQPDLGEAHFALALYHYWGRLDYGPAVAQLRVAREALPNSADVVSIIASVARRQNRWDEAIAGFRQATLLDPRSPFPLDQLALAYGSLRRYAEADRAFGQAVALSPDPTEERVTHALNSVWWHGDLAPLRAALGELTPGSDGYAGYVPVMWRMHWWARDYAAAIAVATANGSERWNNRKVYLAYAYHAAGNAAAARAESTAAVDSTRAALVQRPDDPGLHLILGFCEAELGRKDDALREGRKAAELMPPSRDVLAGSDVMVGLAALEVRVGDNDAAFEHLRQALALSSGGSISPALLKLDPAWDPIRNDPRFAQLLVLGEGPVKIATMP
jgi:tetratricopeptide (TPR) repeat protein